MNLANQISAQDHKMIMYEGMTLISIVILGSIFFITYVWQDHKRNQKVKLFFSIFSHDIKTSISRLRLQAEILEEDLKLQALPNLNRLIQDVTRLDLQLDNSLMFANINNHQFYIEKTRLSQLIGSIRPNFSNLNIEIDHDAELLTDTKWFNSIIKNIFQNSILHGNANLIHISCKKKSQKLEIIINDNGSGFSNPHSKVEQLGTEILKTKTVNSNGIGLYLCKSLIKKLDGEILFSSNKKGFITTILIPGELI